MVRLKMLLWLLSALVLGSGCCDGFSNPGLVVSKRSAQFYQIHLQYKNEAQKAVLPSGILKPGLVSTLPHPWNQYTWKKATIESGFTDQNQGPISPDNFFVPQTSVDHGQVPFGQVDNGQVDTSSDRPTSTKADPTLVSAKNLTASKTLDSEDEETRSIFLLAFPPFLIVGKRSADIDPDESEPFHSFQKESTSKNVDCGLGVCGNVNLPQQRNGNQAKVTNVVPNHDLQVSQDVVVGKKKRSTTSTAFQKGESLQNSDIEPINAVIGRNKCSASPEFVQRCGGVVIGKKKRSTFSDFFHAFQKEGSSQNLEDVKPISAVTGKNNCFDSPGFVQRSDVGPEGCGGVVIGKKKWSTFSDFFHAFQKEGSLQNSDIEPISAVIGRNNCSASSESAQRSDVVPGGCGGVVIGKKKRSSDPVIFQTFEAGSQSQNIDCGIVGCGAFNQRKKKRPSDTILDQTYTSGFLPTFLSGQDKDNYVATKSEIDHVQPIGFYPSNFASKSPPHLPSISQLHTSQPSIQSFEPTNSFGTHFPGTDYQPQLFNTHPNQFFHFGSLLESKKLEQGQQIPVGQYLVHGTGQAHSA